MRWPSVPVGWRDWAPSCWGWNGVLDRWADGRGWRLMYSRNNSSRCAPTWHGMPHYDASSTHCVSVHQVRTVVEAQGGSLTVHSLHLCAPSATAGVLQLDQTHTCTAGGTAHGRSQSARRRSAVVKHSTWSAGCPDPAVRRIWAVGRTSAGQPQLPPPCARATWAKLPR